jgi:hypothetical protein
LLFPNHSYVMLNFNINKFFTDQIHNEYICGISLTRILNVLFTDLVNN